nr:MAG TPA: hypothetical protein [Caudoviricetes sp.]
MPLRRYYLVTPFPFQTRKNINFPIKTQNYGN